KDFKWLRLLYCYPGEIDADVINLIKTDKIVLRYIDMPLQHINDDILKSMHRPTTKEKVVSLIHRLRSEIPDIIIRTTFIVGFPGETEEEYEELIDFIKEMKLDKVGAFAYSREKNTISYDLKNQVPDDIKEKRLTHLLDVQKNIVKEKKRSYIGKTYEALIEGYDTYKKMYVVRSYIDAREIEEVIYVRSDRQLMSGAFVDVKIIDTYDIDLIGEVR
ncbi:MAG: radical SAM protein, partial [Lachnospiraceae bacterium]|nr:radical SAM protein [Lachnospiraceae bacterium]